MSDWSRERIEQLAPDAASFKSGAGLAKTSHWQNLGRQDAIIWGECQGSGAKPYQVRFALDDAGYRCTCPSRKQPCKHTLGLLLLHASGEPFAQMPPPGFVDEWQDNRSKRAETRAARENSPPAEPDAAARAKRQEKRENRILTGIDQLEAWLSDLISQGLANVRNQVPDPFASMASRLVDAQAPGLANKVRELDALIHGGEHWSDRTLVAMGRLQLLVDAYRRVDSLPDSLAAEVRTLAGWTQKQEHILAQAGVRDAWTVVGKRVRGDETLRSQSIWLRGRRNSQIALLLEFAVGRQPFSSHVTIGHSFEAELCFFAGIRPCRAMIKPPEKPLPPSRTLGPAIDVSTLQSEFAAALASNPWEDRWAACIGPVSAATSADRTLLRDAAGRSVALRSGFRHGWSLAALTGGCPCTVFGEWNGSEFDPFTIEYEGLLYVPERIGALDVLGRAV